MALPPGAFRVQCSSQIVLFTHNFYSQACLDKRTETEDVSVEFIRTLTIEILVSKAVRIPGLF